ncbi:MAG: alpha-glucan family phosphorylase [Phycisphaerae bacterium]|jgi:starch phosphorylase
MPSPDLRLRLEALAGNLWWTWNSPAQRLFAALDPVLWDATNHNPLETLARLSPARLEACAADKSFRALLKEYETLLRAYLRAGMWFARTAKHADKRLRVAYFCAEYALHECLPQYAGGLGVLAGDHLKSTSDLGVPLVAVGLLYRCGYYQQSFASDGSTLALYPECDYSLLPLTDTRQHVTVPLAGRKVTARIWRADVGRVPLYLLDSDVRRNRPADRAITRHLYGGDQETRLSQEILLGVGGTRALEQLHLRPNVFHLNEGHAAFCTLERLRRLRRAGRTFARAIENVRASTVFTTHTPVPAGHDRFEPKLTTRYLAPLMREIGVPRNEFLGLGRENSADRTEPFCMTVLALRLSGRCNGVSRLHGEVSRRMWMDVFDAKRPEDVPIGHVTNGVHSQTWLAPEVEGLYQRHLKPRWLGAGPRHNPWQRAPRIPAGELWSVRRQLRARLVQFIRERLRDQIARRLGPVGELSAACEMFDEDVLTIGFARRFATYKRAPLIFRDLPRLAAILNDPDRPVQIVFAGKAHPRDAAGQAFARQIYTLAHKAGLRGRVALLENYDMQVGRLLTAGCDVWLNNPLRPQEASGTSGMKPPLHGGLNCSILDGWWPEAFDHANGWAIVGGPAKSKTARDRADADALYDLLEREIVPLFYERDRENLPRRWIQRMLRSMRTVCGQFNTHHMVAEYVRDYYLPSRR